MTEKTEDFEISLQKLESIAMECEKRKNTRRKSKLVKLEQNKTFVEKQKNVAQKNEAAAEVDRKYREKMEQLA